MKVGKVVYAGLFAAFLSSCSGGRNIQQAAACEENLKIAFAELDAAKARGLSGTVALTKATSLLTAAKIQQQFEKYPNCIDKVKRARYYIKTAK